jgi:hypothetical protein
MKQLRTEVLGKYESKMAPSADSGKDAGIYIMLLGALTYTDD